MPMAFVQGKSGTIRRGDSDNETALVERDRRFQREILQAAKGELVHEADFSSSNLCSRQWQDSGKNSWQVRRRFTHSTCSRRTLSRRSVSRAGGGSQIRWPRFKQDRQSYRNSCLLRRRLRKSPCSITILGRIIITDH